jgi:hypothetical protein
LLFDRETESVFGQLDGLAAAGRLHAEAAVLRPYDVRVTTWGAWKTAHPESTTISDDAGIGRVYVADPLGGRAAEAEYPVGSVDDRLPADAAVVGVTRGGAAPIAFDLAAVNDALDHGTEVELDGVQITRDAGGLAAVSTLDDASLVAVETRWFAWSSVRPSSEVWTG